MSRQPSARKPRSRRSSRWPAFRRAVLKEAGHCEACGRSEDLEVHHVLPVHFPGGRDRELDRSNVMVLCESSRRHCHLAVGHLLDFHARNPSARADAAAYRGKIGKREYAPAGRPGKRRKM